MLRKMPQVGGGAAVGGGTAMGQTSSGTMTVTTPEQVAVSPISLTTRKVTVDVQPPQYGPGGLCVITSEELLGS